MRSKLLKISNYALFLSMCVTVSVGFILAFRLPSGPMSKGVQLLGLMRHNWCDVHLVSAITFCVFAILHLWLNWSWITKVAAQGNRLLLIMSLAIGFLIIVIPLLVPI